MSSGEKKQLGRILLKQRKITQNGLDQLLADQRASPGHRLASTALRTGAVTPVDLLKALSEQHGLPGIDLAQVVVPLENLQFIPIDIARQHLILPILVKEDRVFLAMADPSNRRVIDEIEFVTGRRVFPYVALHDAILDVIEECYTLREQRREHYVGDQVPPDYLRSLGLEVSDPEPGEASASPASAPAEGPASGEAKGSLRGPSAITDSPSPGVVMLDEQAAIPTVTGGREAAALDEAFEAQVEAIPEPVQKPREGPPIVLVVDDEDDIRRLLARVLSQKGYEVVEASRGSEALEKVRDHLPDLIVLDAMMPEIHGFDICRRIKGSKRYGHIPIVMVSAVYRGWRVAEDLKTSYGVEAFIEKPFKISDVLAEVERCIAGRSVVGDVAEAELSAEAGAALEEGLAAYKAGNLELAIARLREGVAFDPLAFQLRYHLGLLSGRTDSVFEAIHELETAVDLKPRHYSALKNLAILYQRAGFRLKAIEMWERAMAVAPDEVTRKGIREHLLTLF
ncbi:MAG: response regulator [Myxococcales bacterium]|nr:response regulator [Myxococcales bacterium]